MVRSSTRKSISVQTAKTVAFVPLHPGVDCRALGDSLANAFKSIALTAGTVDREAIGRESEWFANIETKHDVMFYIGDSPDSAWTQLCIRQADRIILVARAGEPVAHQFHSPETRGRLRRQHPELLLLRKEDGLGLSDTQLGDRTQIGQHYYLRDGNKADVERFARILSGRAVSLVLALCFGPWVTAAALRISLE